MAARPLDAREIDQVPCELRAACQVPVAVLELSALQGVDFARARAQLSPSVSLLRVQRRALDAFLHDGLASTDSEEDDALGCAVFRSGHHSAQRALDTSEYDALCALEAGRDFAAVCEFFGEAHQAAHAIGRWIRDSWLCALQTS